ncbi:hypothetical protein evm_010361 [Chilo suppressalis]|nr:hypothetical protein evm_010361 [Chilo suppressalis]
MSSICTPQCHICTRHFKRIAELQYASPHLKWDIVLAQYKKEATLTNSFSSRVLLPNTNSVRSAQRSLRAAHRIGAGPVGGGGRAAGVPLGAGVGHGSVRGRARGLPRRLRVPCGGGGGPAHVGGGGGAGGGRGRVRAGPAPPQLAGAVPAYAALLAAMAWRGLARGGYSAPGAMLFLLSDAVLAHALFDGPVPYERVLVMSTYYLGQLGIALSVLDEERKHLQINKKA